MYVALFSLPLNQKFQLESHKNKACFVPYNRNSEIYNHDVIKAKHLPGVRIVKDSKSDSAIIGHLYQACHLPAPC